jgi:dsDNA-specific endonuclease/ATPase MutS2
LAIARRLGLPEEVLDHAASGPDEDDTAEMINALQAARAQSVENRQETDRARAEALRLEQEHRTRLESVEAREAIIDSHADQAVAETLERIKTQLDRLRKTEPSRRALLNALSDLGHLIDNPSDIAPHTAATETFQPGDTVRVRSLDSGRRGENSGLRKSVFAKFWAPPYSA